MIADSKVFKWENKSILFSRLTSNKRLKVVGKTLFVQRLKSGYTETFTGKDYYSGTSIRIPFYVYVNFYLFF